MDEQLYTLDEARAELARQACNQDGHDYSVVAVKSLAEAGEPCGVRCDRCHSYWPIGQTQEAESQQTLRDRYADALAATCKRHEIEGGCIACDRRIAAVLAVRDDELADLRTRLAEYENTITWNTTCKACARTLDSAYAETVRREQAEAVLARVRALAQQARPSGVAACTCWDCEDDETPNCGQGRVVAWNLDPAAVMAALDVPADPRETAS